VFALLAAAEVADKTPFYVFAGALAAWAVVLSAIGLRSPSFPGGERGGRLVMLASVLLAAAAMTAAVAT